MENDFAKWLVEMDMNAIFNLPLDFTFNVHSENSVGKATIEAYLKKYLAFKANASNGILAKYDRLYIDVSYGEKIREKS